MLICRENQWTCSYIKGSEVSRSIPDIDSMTVWVFRDCCNGGLTEIKGQDRSTLSRNVIKTDLSPAQANCEWSGQDSNWQEILKVLTWWDLVPVTNLRWSSLLKNVALVNQVGVKIPRLSLGGCTKQRLIGRDSKGLVSPSKKLRGFERHKDEKATHGFRAPDLSTLFKIPYIGLNPFPASDIHFSIVTANPRYNEMIRKDKQINSVLNY